MGGDYGTRSERLLKTHLLHNTERNSKSKEKSQSKLQIESKKKLRTGKRKKEKKLRTETGLLLQKSLRHQGVKKPLAALTVRQQSTNFGRTNVLRLSPAAGREPPHVVPAGLTPLRSVRLLQSLENTVLGRDGGRGGARMCRKGTGGRHGGCAGDRSRLG